MSINTDTINKFLQIDELSIKELMEWAEELEIENAENLNIEQLKNDIEQKLIAM